LTAAAVSDDRRISEFWCRPLRDAARRHAPAKAVGNAHRIRETPEETAMEIRRELQKPPDILSAQGVSNDLVKRIRKLRWMRMDEEVESLQGQLSLCGVPAAESVIAASDETD
jgi:hypothetical protein